MNELKKFAAGADNPKWADMVSRSTPLYKREGDIRDEFTRDYTRILHCTAFRRLKHKTQVFFSPQSDHICTRIEHVLLVESTASSIAASLGLNLELTRAIAIAHDLGHPPFGHKGEKTIKELYRKYVGEDFWHEKNGVFIADNTELLSDDEDDRQPLNLTYAVRDGIISHCGETTDRKLFPRAEAIRLEDFNSPNCYPPFTYEACAVKMSDTISYIGRDIEDAIKLKILDEAKLKELSELFEGYTHKRFNNSFAINHLITDICQNSNEQNGMSFSAETSAMLKELKEFNGRNIYQNERVVRADKYFELIINEIFNLLGSCFDGDNTLNRVRETLERYPNIMNSSSFIGWLKTYSGTPQISLLKEKPIYDFSNRASYFKAVLDYISGMTDKYAIDTYNAIISF